MKYHISLTEEFVSRSDEIDRFLEPIGLLTQLQSFNQLSEVDFIFCDTKYIKELNHKFRKLDEATDILSFPNESEDGGELYISIDIINENLISNISNPSEKIYFEEVLRIIIHGLLHLVGYDHTDKLQYGEEKSSDNEMYKKQEEILGILLSKL